MKVQSLCYVLAGLLLTSLYVGLSTHRGESRQIQVAHDSLRVALADAGRQQELVDFLTTRASLAEERADAEAARADSLERIAVKARVRYVDAAATAPDTCAPYIALANEALATTDSVAEARRRALQSSQEAASGFHAALDTAKASNARLRAAGTAVVASQPSRFSRLLPRVGVGAAAGVNPLTGHPSLTTGITFGWTF